MQEGRARNKQQAALGEGHVIEMAKNNLTARSSTHLPHRWEEQRKLWSGEPVVKGFERADFVRAAGATFLVLVACLLVSNWHLKRNKGGKTPMPRGDTTRDVQMENRAEGSVGNIELADGFSALCLCPRWIFRVCSVLLLTAVQPFQQRGNSRQHGDSSRYVLNDDANNRAWLLLVSCCDGIPSILFFHISFFLLVATRVACGHTRSISCCNLYTSTRTSYRSTLGCTVYS